MFKFYAVENSERVTFGRIARATLGAKERANQPEGHFAEPTDLPLERARRREGVSRGGFTARPHEPLEGRAFVHRGVCVAEPSVAGRAGDAGARRDGEIRDQGGFREGLLDAAAAGVGGL